MVYLLWCHVIYSSMKEFWEWSVHNDDGKITAEVYVNWGTSCHTLSVVPYQRSHQTQQLTGRESEIQWSLLRCYTKEYDKALHLSLAANHVQCECVPFLIFKCFWIDGSCRLCLLWWKVKLLHLWLASPQFYLKNGMISDDDPPYGKKYEPAQKHSWSILVPRRQSVAAFYHRHRPAVVRGESRRNRCACSAFLDTAVP